MYGIIQIRTVTSIAKIDPEKDIIGVKNYSVRTLDLSNGIIKLVYLGESEITVFFDKKTLDLKGWRIIDQYNNNINFSLKIVAKNNVFKKETFKIPEMN